jgi:coenzyme F420 hydrogenase subunit beta
MNPTSNFFPHDRYRDVEGILRVVRDGLCHRCGACIGVCPVGTFGMNEIGQPIQVADCIHCNICVQTCPGLAVDYEEIGRALFGNGYRYGDLLGVSRRAGIAHALDNEIRSAGASGGVVTQMLTWLLETGKIRGALVAIEDPGQPARGRGSIARSRGELIASAQSRYTTAPSLHALYDIKDEEGPFAIVGLPCQVHALRSRQMADPRWKNRIPYVIGLVCHYNLPVESSLLAASLVTPPGAKVVHVNFRQKDERGWPHNTLTLTFSDGRQWRCPFGPKETFNVISSVSRLGRCLTCMDAGAEFADFTVGDPWIRGASGAWKYEEPRGYSAVIVHTARGEEMIDAAVCAGVLGWRHIPEEDLHSAWDDIALDKKVRVGLRLKGKRFLGRAVPRYSVPIPWPSAELLLEELSFWGRRILPSLGPLRRVWLRFWFSPRGAALMHRLEEHKKARHAGSGEGA